MTTGAIHPLVSGDPDDIIGIREAKPSRRIEPQSANGASGGASVGASGNKREPGIKRLSDVAMLPIIFIDKPLFQANAFHLLAGKKNSGKGTFLSAVAARFTRGELGGKRNVLWISAGEDSMSLDVRPRLEAVRGDTSRVYFPDEAIRLPQGVQRMREIIERVGDIGFVVLDPISGMLSEGTNTNMDADVRHAISPLNELADDFKCVVVGVRHLKKDASQGALESVLGSSDWVNVPRAVLAMAIDDDDENIRHVQVAAGNRLPRGTASRSFRIVGADVVPGGEQVALAEFIDGPGKSVDEMLQSNSVTNSKTKQSRMAILDQLEQSGETDSDEQNTEVAATYGLSVGSVRNSKTWLKNKGLVKFVPVKDAHGKVTKFNVARTETPRPDALNPVHHSKPSSPVHP